MTDGKKSSSSPVKSIGDYILWGASGVQVMMVYRGGSVAALNGKVRARTSDLRSKMGTRIKPNEQQGKVR